MEKMLRARFYQTCQGNEPVREWLLSLDKESRSRIGEDIRAVEKGWPIGMPVCRPLGNGLFEVRTHLKDTIARVIFFVCCGEMRLLHGFTKKTQQISSQDMRLALERKKDSELRQ